MSNKDKQLSEAEIKRAEQFEKISDEMKQKGFTRHDLTISISKANLFAAVLFAVLAVMGYGVYYLIHHRLDIARFNIIILAVLFVVLIVVHELIHGITWSIFTPNHFKDIEFGVLRSSFTPYCTCKVPLDKMHYMIGSAMPLIVLGIIPLIAGIVLANPTLLFLGILMADSAAGDIMIIQKIASYQSDADEIVYMDHPTEPGCVVFDK